MPPRHPGAAPARHGHRLNYRHAFHAGNFADCVKHAILVWLLRALHRKPAAVFVLDTHAGAGLYDLSADPSQRTGEAEAGILRLLRAPPTEALADYLSLVRPQVEQGRYPGSPVLIRDLLRPDDQLACCELHPEDHAALRRLLGRDTRIGVHRRDAWEALGALLPPRQKRAMVLIDPPFEAPDEFARLVAGLRTAQARMPAAVLAAWYPVKTRRQARGFHDQLRAAELRDVVAAELWLREPTDPARLNGCGMLLVNPPFGFETAMPPLLSALLAALGQGEAGAGTSVERLTDE